MQVLLPIGKNSALIAGIPAALRTADYLRSVPAVSRVLILADNPEILQRWKDVIARWTDIVVIDSQAERLPHALSNRLLPEPVILLSGEGILQPSVFERWTQNNKYHSPVTWAWKTTPVAAIYPNPKELLDRLPHLGLPLGQVVKIALEPESAELNSLAVESWQPLRNLKESRQAEQHLFETLRKSTDGYLARLDRSLSIALSKRLINTPITPNQITIFSLVIGLSGACLLALAGYAGQVLGAVLLCSSCILDGCDGEVARLNLLSSPEGARYDVIADNIVHIAIFVAIILHTRRLHPNADWRLPGISMVLGVIASMFTVWWLILRQYPEQTSDILRFYERIASRDFIYLLLLLVLLQRVEWFIWGAAIGSHIFWVSLWAWDRFPKQPA